MCKNFLEWWYFVLLEFYDEIEISYEIKYDVIRAYKYKVWNRDTTNT